MKYKINECNSFYMYNMSISILFKKTPKIHYECWNCNGSNCDRAEIGNRFIVKCKLCGALNEIPIKIGE